VVAVNEVGTSDVAGARPWPLVAESLSARKTPRVGASGEVYAAEDVADHAACVVKLFPAGLEPAAITRLLDEFGRLSELATGASSGFGTRDVSPKDRWLGDSSW